MGGLFGRKPGGNSSLLADGSFMLFGCGALLFLLAAAPLLALVIVSREGLSELAHNVAAAFAGDRLWVLVAVIVAGAVVRYAIAGPLVDWLKAREAAQQEQVIYPPTPAVTVESNRGYSSMEVKQLMEIMQQGMKPTALPDEKPTRLTGASIPRRPIGQAAGGESGGIGWKGPRA